MKLGKRLRQCVWVGSVGWMLLAVGCVLPPPPAAVLEGDWYGTTEDNLDLVVTFDSSGVVVTIVATNDMEESATATVNNASTELDGSDVTESSPRTDGTIPSRVRCGSRWASD